MSSSSKPKALAKPTQSEQQTRIHPVFDAFYLKLEEPLPFVQRFLSSAFGSFTFFSTAYYLDLWVSGSASSDSTPAADLTGGDAISETGATVLTTLPAFAFTYWIVAGLMISAFAMLISTAATKHSHVRLYLIGLLLPALSLVVTRAAWSV